MKPYYEHAGITIYHGDCREVLPGLDVDVALFLTDPPYQFENSGGGFYGAWEGRNQGSHDPRTYLNELRDLNCVDCEPSSFLPLFGESSAVIFCNKALIADYLQWARERKFLYDVHVMSKTNPIPVKSNHFIHDLEYIVLFRKKQSYFDDSGPMHLYRKLFTVSGGGDSVHPAQKPTELLAKYADVLCPKDGIVCDPFLGSGSTLVAAKQKQRSAVGIEIEEKYCEIAAKRLSQEVLAF
jgi:site-specific DNA-methyltransferase (adenine-specific)